MSVCACECACVCVRVCTPGGALSEFMCACVRVGESVRE